MPPPSQLGPKLATGGSADIFAWGERQVIKRFRRGTPPAAAMQEAACTRAARDAGAPAPETSDVVQTDGHVALIFERITGSSLLEALFTGVQDPVSVGRSLGLLHAGLHTLRSVQLPEQHERLREALARVPFDDLARQRIASTLERLPFGDSVCHGDFHPGNVLLTAAGPMLIDWYDATRGCPVADVAQTSLLLLHAEPPGMIATGMRAHIDRLRAAVHDAYLAQYRDLRPIDERELADWSLVMAAARLARRPSQAEHAALVNVIRRHLQRLQTSPS
jgi:Ser/Thr protein kinase RdoA (MazF antagonist)